MMRAFSISSVLAVFTALVRSTLRRAIDCG
jgi:hypothetical protein